MLITRSVPDELPLGILRVRGELVEIDAPGLLFTRAEMAEFLRQASPVALPDEAVAQLEQRTEGWPAGLRLAALALQGKTSPPEAGRLLAQSLFFFVFNGINSIAAVYYIDRFGVLAANMAVLFATGGVVNVIVQVGLVGKLAPRFGEKSWL